MGSSPGHSAQKSYVSACGSAPRSAARRISQAASALDPTAAAKIHANDAAKVIRAVEVCLTARGPMSQLWMQRGRDPLRGFRILRIGLSPEREALYVRLNQRAGQMFDSGLIEETKTLLEQFGGSKNVMPLEFSWLQAGGAIPAWRVYARAGAGGDTARPSQLC